MHPYTRWTLNREEITKLFITLLQSFVLCLMVYKLFLFVFIPDCWRFLNRFLQSAFRFFRIDADAFGNSQ